MFIWTPTSCPYSPGMTPSDFYLFPKLKIQSSWYTVWKQLRRNRGSKRVLGGPGKGLLFWRDKKLEQRCTLPLREISLKVNFKAKFSFIVAWSTRADNFLIIPWKCVSLSVCLLVYSAYGLTLEKQFAYRICITWSFLVLISYPWILGWS